MILELLLATSFAFRLPIGHEYTECEFVSGLIEVADAVDYSISTNLAFLDASGDTLEITEMTLYSRMGTGGTGIHDVYMRVPGISVGHTSTLGTGRPDDTSYWTLLATATASDGIVIYPLTLVFGPGVTRLLFMTGTNNAWVYYSGIVCPN